MIKTFKLLGLALLVSSCAGKEAHNRTAATADPSPSPQSTDAIPASPSPEPGQVTSVQAFEKTLYPILRKNCKQCHGAQQGPLFALDDVDKSHTAILQAKKINFEEASRSAISRKPLVPGGHNCWAYEDGNIDCQKNAKDIEDAIAEWKKEMTETPVVEELIKLTDALGFDKKMAPTARVVTGTILLEAESVVPKAPMIVADDPGLSGGKFVSLPAISTNNANPACARGPADNAAGSIILNIDVKDESDYWVWSKVSVEADTDQRVYIAIDADAPVIWKLPVTGKKYTWARATNGPNISSVFVKRLTPGPHTLTIRECDDGSKFDRFAVTNDATFKDNEPVEVLRFDVSKYVETENTFFEIEIADYDASVYKFRNPRIFSTKEVKVKNIQIKINGQIDSNNATYTLVDKVIPAPGGLVSNSAMTVKKEKGPAEDQFSFVFGILE